MNDLVITIPVGVSSPGTPVIPYLKACLNSLNNQKTSYKYKVVIASDSNVSKEAMDCMLESGFDIQLYEPFYYMRRGGIWKKIYDQWSNFETKYIAWSHYDDIWGDNKIHSQISLMENNNLEISWSNVQIIDKNNNIVSPNVLHHEKLNKQTLKTGKPYAFCHATIFKKTALYETGILDKIEKGSAIYEDIQYIYSHKLKGMKDNNSTFYHRQHQDSVSNNFNIEKEYMVEQRIIADYSLEQVLKDAEDLNMHNVIEEIKKSLS